MRAIRPKIHYVSLHYITIMHRRIAWLMVMIVSHIYPFTVLALRVTDGNVPAAIDGILY
jgi:hypothetical protein